MSAYSIEFYRLNIANNSFDYMGACFTFLNLYYDFLLDGIGTCTFDLNTKDMFANEPHLRRMSTVIVLKNGNTPLWSGVIGDVTGKFEDVGGTITVQAYSPLYWLKFRYTPKSVIYSQIDQEAIAWSLISTSQANTNGTLLMNQGVNAASVLRDRIYSYGLISDSLINLSNVIAGFDFQFTPVFNASGRLTSFNFDCFYPAIGRLRNDLPSLQLGTSVYSVSFDTISSLTNAITTEGAGTGTPISYTNEDSSSEQAFTRIEEYLPQKDVSVQSTLQTNADSELNNNKTEGYKIGVQFMPNIIPSSTLSIGDYLLLNLNMGSYMNFVNRQVRITKLSVQVDDEGVEYITSEVTIYG